MARAGGPPPRAAAPCAAARHSRHPQGQGFVLVPDGSREALPAGRETRALLRTGHVNPTWGVYRAGFSALSYACLHLRGQLPDVRACTVCTVSSAFLLLA